LCSGCRSLFYHRCCHHSLSLSWLRTLPFPVRPLAHSSCFQQTPLCVSPRQAGLSCSLLVAAYIMHQRLQPFLTTKPLSSRIKLTPLEIHAILVRGKEAGVEGARSLPRETAVPGTSVVRRRTRGASILAAPGVLQASADPHEGIDPGQATAHPALVSALPRSRSGRQRARVRQSIVHLARDASARTFARSLSFVINFNHLVGGPAHVALSNVLPSTCVLHLSR
jgi:hypothetical protein